MAEEKYPVSHHLEELRVRSFYCLAAFFILSIVAWQYTPAIINLLAAPVKKLVFLQVTEGFYTYLKVTMWAGFFLASPVIFYHFWRYIESALLPQEKKYVIIFAPFSLLLFLLGSSFAFFLAVPVAVRFLITFGSSLATPMLSLSEYVSFFGWLVLVFGISFEFPLVILFLIKLKIIPRTALGKFRKHAIVAILILAAILTPTPDMFTQLLLAGPLLILYEAAALLARFVG